MKGIARMSCRIPMMLACCGLGIVAAGNVAPDAARAGEQVGHSMVRQAGEGEATRRVTVGLNKSLIVDLPRAARDILVSSPEIADAVVRSQRRSFIIGRKVGQTNVFFFDIEGRQILSLELEVVHDVAALSKTLRRLLPQSNIKVDGVADAIVLSGSAANAGDADRAVKITRQFIADADGKRVVNMIGIEGDEQVALKVTIAEMQRNTIKQLGVNISAAGNIGSTVLNFASLNPFTLAGTPPSSAGFNSIGGANCLVATAACADTILKALERNGLIRTLAEPTLTSLSGETASFLAGGEFPVPVGGDNDSVTIEFKPFGVNLAFTPVVLSEGRISLKIGTEVSELTNENAVAVAVGEDALLTIPGLKVRRSESTVELPSGGSLMLAGLIQENTKQELNGFPGLKDLPVLGSLFRSREFENSETELVVIATPYLVNPTNRGELARPDEGFAQPSDIETTFMGRLNAVYGMRTGSRPRGSYQGDVGFIVK